MAKLKDTQIDGNLYVSEDIQIGDISVTDKIDELNDAYYNNPSYSNPNLLINGDFRVNQRGGGTYPYNNNNLYTVDRWMMPTGTGKETVEVVSDGIIVRMSADITINPHVMQRFESLKDGVYTLSAKVDGVIKSHTFNYQHAYVDKIFDDGIFLAMSYSNNIPSVAVGMMRDKKSQMKIEWVKLEQGSVATPFVPRLYAEELALCQRYFINYKPLDHTGLLGSGGNTIYIPMQFLTNMRTKPTIIHNITKLSVYINASNKTMTSPTITLNNDYELTFSATSTVGTHTDAAGCYWASGSTLQFDAEIY